jgi:hypothetical protein
MLRDGPAKAITSFGYSAIRDYIFRVPTTKPFVCKGFKWVKIALYAFSAIAEVQIVGLTNQVRSMTASNAGLSSENSNVQKKYDNDETIIRAYNVIKGTNQFSTPDSDDIAAAISENTYSENIVATDSNRCWILETSPSNRTLILKLKHPPLDYSMSGTVISETLNPHQNIVTHLYHVHNIAYTFCQGNWNLNDGNFIIQYIRNRKDTNLIQKVSISGGWVLLDGNRIILSAPPDKP